MVRSHDQQNGGDLGTGPAESIFSYLPSFGVYCTKWKPEVQSRICFHTKFYFYVRWAMEISDVLVYGEYIHGA